MLAQKDLMRWGSCAIAGFAAAVLSANVAAFLPEQWLTGLHATRIEGGTLPLLRAEVATLRGDLGRAERANAVLSTRLTLIEDNRVNVARRVGALEASIPMLLEALPYDAEIDFNLLTAGIGNAEEGPAEGGSVSVRMTPLFDAEPTPGAPAAFDAQPLPDPVAAGAGAEVFEPEAGAFGLALGAALRPEVAWRTWRDIGGTVGGLLIGLNPLLAPDDNGDGAVRLLAGPVASYAEATSLCAAISAREVACQPAPFEGVALAPETP
ncbi:MAG TPA: hypothetical protein VMW31_05175 [Devosiaceae bacterium]|nr:hypothetical protein [Devosiaceae bacterium]